MFTPSMTEEEIQQAAYKDYLEIRTRVQIAFEHFAQSMRISGKHKRAIHSLCESHTLFDEAWKETVKKHEAKSFLDFGIEKIADQLRAPLERKDLFLP